VSQDKMSKYEFGKLVETIGDFSDNSLLRAIDSPVASDISRGGRDLSLNTSKLANCGLTRHTQADGIISALGDLQLRRQLLEL
jgi:hypothetical protein